VEAALRARAAAALRASAGADDVRDLEFEVQFTQLRATAVRLPAYVLRFTHGTVLSDDQSKAILPERCVVRGKPPRVRTLFALAGTPSEHHTRQPARCAVMR
jgi:hypothetical protein